ncbi:MAG: bis(5'-nucleosyl)-tetraphosphatase [Candidatus Yanofskybacteria bacterium]|nr:bis(5'-nucleosyl)-tetraphosphatase [Candidatus Yanofskybacteria bacterium]
MNSQRVSKTKQRPSKDGVWREKSAGAVIVRMEQQVPFFLLLHYPSARRAKREYWDLPKGHMEKGETEQETARREVEEETGLSDIVFEESFREPIHYTFQFQEKRISKTVIFFLARTNQEQVKISHEHVGYIWLPYEEALERLTFANARRVLKAAQKFLREAKTGK